MKPADCLGCRTFPCRDINKKAYVIPGVDLKPARISIMLISEAAPPNPADYYYASGNPSFAQTTVQAFQDAAVHVTSIQDILKLGVYLTTAVKCGKTSYGIAADTIEECSYILEQELALFPNLKACLLMGDVAIKAFNYLAIRQGAGRVIPAGSTYKIRGRKYSLGSMRLFPSYLQAGPSFNIEKSKRRMIAQDIAAAVHLVR